MTNDELQAHIKAIEEAIESGLVEEKRPGHVWELPTDNAMLIGHDDGSMPKYRIKPKPLECWVVIDKEDNSAVRFSEADARDLAKEYEEEYRQLNPHRVIHMREVTDE